MSNFYVRKAEKSDIEEILKIYAGAREFMKKNGNPTQWGDSWPLDEDIEKNIDEKKQLVACFKAGNQDENNSENENLEESLGLGESEKSDRIKKSQKSEKIEESEKIEKSDKIDEEIEESEEIAATFLFLSGPEAAYNSLKDGNWPENTEDYFVIHSFASSMKACGAATFCFEWCEKQPGVRCIKVDTHKNNIPMQNLLKKLGYAYCGKCYYFDEVRFGEKIINETECLAFCKSIDDSEILKRDYDAERLAFCKKI